MSVWHHGREDRFARKDEVLMFAGRTAFERFGRHGLIVLAALSTPAVAQPPEGSVCPTCRTGVATVATSAASSIDCGIEVLPLTADVARDFGLPELRAFLARPNFVTARFERGAMAAELAKQGEMTVELNVELGDSTYHEVSNEYCDDYVETSARIRVSVGQGFLYFEADGTLWTRRDDISTRFYAAADLVSAVGTFRPHMDPSRLHGGGLEASFQVAPGHMRGVVNVAAYHFDDEAQLQRFKAGEWRARDYELLLQLAFPEDRCNDHEVPFAYHEPVELLHGRTGDELRARVEQLVAAHLNVDARWRDGSDTELTLELGEPVGGTVCLGRELTGVWPTIYGRALRMPLEGRIRSLDGRLDAPVNELVVAVDENNELRAAVPRTTLDAVLSDVQRQNLDSSIDAVSMRWLYEFGGGVVDLDGTVDLLESTGPTTYRRADCIAFPRDGRSDTDDCGYTR